MSWKQNAVVWALWANYEVLLSLSDFAFRHDKNKKYGELHYFFFLSFITDRPNISEHGFWRQVLSLLIENRQMDRATSLYKAAMYHTDDPMLEAWVMEEGRSMHALCLNSTEKADAHPSADWVLFSKLTFDNFSYQEIKKVMEKLGV